MAGIRSLLSCTTILLTASAYAAIGPVTDLTVSDANIAPDGFTRAAIVVNGVFPAPLITGKKGDHFKLNVIDQMTNHTMNKTTSIHWHGIFQHGTNWADGPAFVTQCPIASGNSFLYDFTVPDQAGTFWYHSHLTTQYCDGLRGPLVIYDPHDPLAHLYDVDNDSTVITLADWYQRAAHLGPRFPPGPNSTLINGLGRSLNSPNNQLAVVNVTQGKRYRFRLVSMSCDPNYMFSIDGHNLTVIEADGIETQPVTVNTIQIFAAQRYSFVLTANQSVDNYWIRANPNIGSVVGFTDGFNSAILRYVGAPAVDPTTSQQTTQNLLQETQLHPFVPRKTPGNHTAGGVNKPIQMDFSFNGTNFFINNATFVPPTVPVLLQILSGAQSAQSLLPSGSIYELPINSSIEINFPAAANAVGNPHPFHLHGHAFAVVRSAGSSEYNYDNPVWRDTVSTGISSSDNVTIRFQTDNPGPWFLHCHIDFHLDAGFAVVLAEDIPDVASANPVPADWSALCPTYDALSLSDH
ncbi:laccase [Dichomitus squalens]|uniref:laccase n=1 Tax=Dichomitus squalens TaxID=114155 RepID=A0A4Q9MAP2_9APHY|nr:laccase [Dichomitus squalens]